MRDCSGLITTKLPNKKTFPLLPIQRVFKFGMLMKHLRSIPLHGKKYRKHSRYSRVTCFGSPLKWPTFSFLKRKNAETCFAVRCFRQGEEKDPLLLAGSNTPNRYLNTEFHIRFNINFKRVMQRLSQNAENERWKT